MPRPRYKSSGLDLFGALFGALVPETPKPVRWHKKTDVDWNVRHRGKSVMLSFRPKSPDTPVKSFYVVLGKADAVKIAAALENRRTP